MVNDTEYEGMRIAEEIGSKLAELSKMIEAIHYDPEGITKNDIYRLEKINNRLEITINDFYRLDKRKEAKI